ncbi:hypothetical protein TRV_07398 [Trichophyton verrucosum HKI 0517]|uniref:Uncharacterized protein n=1 Tax=Trichophyton verrucosum (strain HKI 0517) TaxID=663202 RepID=D4DJN0_TRIVH|nr:uncharacterized protein TRV_07398 [Trichophyton verrucosum HKI 0517]EFE37908.1 hypothetical protein TRV_07398 [Trichophyton verrucosum HKI 0517]
MTEINRYPYFHPTCPLCQHDVAIEHTSSYRLFPLHQSRYFDSLQEQPQYTDGRVFVQGVLFQIKRFPGVRYTDRAVLIHCRCLSIISHLAPGSVSRLLDLIEPTFLPSSTGPVDEHGAFHHVDGPNNNTINSASIDIDVRKGISKLPNEVWNLISKYDVGRLEFIVRLAAQLQPLSASPLLILDSRFELETVDVRGDTVRIHLVRVGGRVYISHLSDPEDGASTPTKEHDRNTLPYRDYQFGDSTFLAVKTDSIGVVDIALDESDGRPNWIFDHPTAPFKKQISRVRDADLHRLRLSMKCRAILPTNRGGIEPYFDADSMPPGNSWINSSIRVGSWPTQQSDPSTYLAHATYISFQKAQSVTFYTDLVRRGITEVYINERQHRGYSVSFPDVQPSRTFEINGSWLPALPQSGIVIQQVVLDHVIGIWLGETFPLQPVHIGVVRDESAPPLLPGDQMPKVPDLSMFTSRW